MSLYRIFARILLLILGLIFLAFGVSISVRANLGVTPISCIPYIYSLATPFSLGELTIGMNSLFILLQMAILRRRYAPMQLLQLPAVIVLGYGIDYTLPLVSGIVPASYPEQVALLLSSCACIALGVFCVVRADVTYIPGDGLIAVIADTYRREFGKTKMCFDSSMVVIGLVSSLLLLGRLEGIREGTVIAALLVGFLIQLCNRAMAAILGRFEARRKAADVPAVGTYGSFPVITISREYGSGGHEIGQRIARELGIAFYDRELIDLTAEQSGFSQEEIRDKEQKIGNALLHELYAQNYAYVQDRLPPTDLLFLIQSKIIRDICSREACVIVGRCANFILKDNPNCFNVFIHADNEFRKAKIVHEYKAAPTFSDRELELADQERGNYSLTYTGRDWRDATGYHVTLDSALFSTDEAARRLIDLFQGVRPVALSGARAA